MLDRLGLVLAVMLVLTWAFAIVNASLWLADPSRWANFASAAFCFVVAARGTVSMADEWLYQRRFRRSTRDWR
jgi:hypothetical protein